MDARTRQLWMTLREALIIALGGLEDYLGLSRSIEPRRKRNDARADGVHPASA